MEANATATGSIPRTKSGLPAYVVHTNKNGVSFKIANFENPDVCPNKGIVEYEAIKRKDFERIRDTNFACPIVKDPVTEIIYGVFNGFHNNGDPKWINFPLGMLNVWDRSVPTEAKKACILSKSPMTLGSPNQAFRRDLVKFRLVDKEQVAVDKLKKINDAERALAHAKGLGGQKLLDMALNLGINALGASITMITVEVMERAQNDPVGYLKVAENPNIEAISILNKAVDTRVVEIDTHKGYTYKGAPLGHNFDFSIDFLLKNREVLAIIDMASRDAAEQGKKSMKVEEVAEDSSAEIAKLRKQLADAQAEKEALLASKTESGGNEPEYNPLKAKLDELLVIAKEKKLRGLHMYKPNEASIAKLEQAIADKK